MPQIDSGSIRQSPIENGPESLHSEGVKIQVPKLTKAQVNRIFSQLKKEGLTLPKPSSVEVIADEDHAGDPYLRLRVVFPKEIPAEKASWRIMWPFLDQANQWIREQTDYEFTVHDDLVRLSEYEDAQA